MKIVINVPEKVYNHFCRGCRFFDEVEEAIIAITDGTPLKGYGRLGDLDALEKEIINGIKAGNYEEGYEEYGHINNMDDCVECVKYADTIIEADREEGSEK